METRVLALLKSVERTRNPDSIKIRPGRKSRKIESGKGSSKDLTAGLNNKKRAKAAKQTADDLSDEAAAIHQVCVARPALHACLHKHWLVCCQSCMLFSLYTCAHLHT